MKDILNMSHVAGVGVIAIQDAKTNEIVGKIISQFNDSGTATTLNTKIVKSLRQVP